MATFTPASPFPFEDGVTYPAATINQSLTDGTITGITAADVATANKDGLANVPSMRTLGTGAQQAVSGTDERLQQLDENGYGAAKSLVNASGIVAIGSSAAPVAGQVLVATGENAAQWGDISGSIDVDGTGTIETTNGDSVVTGTDTKFLTEMKVGYQIVCNGEVQLVASIESDTSLTTASNWATNNAGQAFTYRIIPLLRPWNVVRSESSTTVTLDSSASGLLLLVNTSGGNVTVNLPDCATIGVNSIAFKKVSNDTNAVTISPDSTQTIDTLANINLQTNGAMATLVSDGVSNWNIVSQQFVTSVVSTGLTLQNQRVETSALSIITSQFPANADLSSAPQYGDGIEIITTATGTSGTGTIVTQSSSTSIVGEGTNFTEQLAVGNVIQGSDGVRRKILTITDDTHLTVDAKWGVNHSSPGISFTFYNTSLVMTPLSVNSRFKYRVCVSGGMTKNGYFVIGLFYNSGAGNTLIGATAVNADGGNKQIQAYLDGTFKPSTSNNITFTLKAGTVPSGSGLPTFNMNGLNANPVQALGGFMNSFVEITELTA